MNVGNHGVGVNNPMMDIGNDYMGVYCELGLYVISWQLPYENDGTYVKDVKDPVEVQPPGGDRLFIGLGVEESRERVPFTPLDGLALNICHSPVIESI